MRQLCLLLAVPMALSAAPAIAAPPAAWNPVAAGAQRSGVYVSPPSLFRDKPATIPVRLENRNPFPVEVSDLAVRPTGGRDVYTGDAATIPAGGVRDVRLDLAEGARQRHRVTFHLGVWHEELDRLAPLDRSEALFRAQTILAAEARLGGNDAEARAWRETLTADAARVTRELQTLQDELCQRERRTWAQDAGKAALDRHGVFRARARTQPDLLNCLSGADDARIAVAALRAGRTNLAQWISVRHDRAAQTPEPFRQILAAAIRSELTAQIGEARKSWSMPSSRLHQWKLSLELLERLRVYDPEDSYMHIAHPGQPVRALERLAREFAVNNDYKEADEALALLAQQHQAGHFPAERLAELRAFVEYERGIHLYNLRRGIRSAHSRSNTAFDIAASHYPIRARGWKVLLVLADNQFVLVMGLFLLGLLLFFGRRTDLWTRLIARLRLMAAGRMSAQSQAAVDQVWDAVTRTATLRKSRINDRFRARIGRAILDRWAATDRRLATEAGQLLAAVGDKARGPQWANATATVRAALAAPDLDEVAVVRARAVWGDEPVVRVLRGVVERDSDAVRAAAHGLQDRELIRTARHRCAVRMANEGPGLQPPAEFWAQVWALCDDATPEAATPGVRRAATFASAACGDTRRAVAWLQAAPEDCAIRRSAALTAARNARLPAPIERSGTVAALRALSQILASWDDDDALDARLRVVVLERLASGDGASKDEAAALLAQADTRRDRIVTVALACALDLLTDGNHGFDDDAQRTLGARWSLLQALDAFTREDMPTAAALLAVADPDAAGTEASTAVRLDCARAVAALAMGRTRASVDALQHALDRTGAMPEGEAASARAVVQTVCAHLAPSLLATAQRTAQLTEEIALGCLQEADSAAVPWLALTRALLELARNDLAARALQRATDGGFGSQEERSALWLTLAKRAIDVGDCRHARACVILARGETPTTIATPTTTG